MVERIYKYSVPFTQAQRGGEVSLPEGAEILSAGFQGTDLVLWAKVFPALPMVPRVFAVMATGEDLPDNTKSWRFIQTVFLDWTVWHVFQVVPQDTDTQRQDET